VAQREAWRIERRLLDANKHELQPLHDVNPASTRIDVLDESRFATMSRKP
jgi:hypothetical protein